MSLQMKRLLASVLFALIVVAAVAVASNVTLPNTFTAGTVARASEVNANFAAIKTSVDDNFTRIQALSIGRVPSNPGTSCADIKNRNSAATDGIYLVDSDGAAGNPPFQVYCDMTRDSGGWTLIMRTWYQSGLTGNANGAGSPQDANSPRNESYKLADAVVQQIIGADKNFDILIDQLFHNTMYSNGNNEYVVVRNYTGTYTYTGPVAESTTATVFESFRASDNALAWRGRLMCGEPGFGFNCFNAL